MACTTSIEPSAPQRAVPLTLRIDAAWAVRVACNALIQRLEHDGRGQRRKGARHMVGMAGVDMMIVIVVMMHALAAFIHADTMFHFLAPNRSHDQCGRQIAFRREQDAG